MSDNFHRNFGSIWGHFLSFEINRTREALQIFGNANNFFILQIIAWHNLYLLQLAEENENYESLREQWGVSNFEIENTVQNKLTVLAVSQLSGIDKETTRRAVKSLVADKWIIYSPSKGITYSPSENNNQLMIKFNETVEIPLFLKLASKIKKLT